MRFGGIGLPKDPALCSPNKSEAEPDAELVWILPIAGTYSEPKTLDDPKITLNQVEPRVSLLRVYMCCFPQQGLPEFRDTELSVEQSVERLDIG